MSIDKKRLLNQVFPLDCKLIDLESHIPASQSKRLTKCALHQIPFLTTQPSQSVTSYHAGVKIGLSDAEQLISIWTPTKLYPESGQCRSTAIVSVMVLPPLLLRRMNSLKLTPLKTLQGYIVASMHPPPSSVEAWRRLKEHNQFITTMNTFIERFHSRTLRFYCKLRALESRTPNGPPGENCRRMLYARIFCSRFEHHWPPSCPAWIPRSHENL
jgi:hypothetical protein